jgi:hypothetical protein
MTYSQKRGSYVFTPVRMLGPDELVPLLVRPMPKPTPIPTTATIPTPTTAQNHGFLWIGRGASLSSNRVASESVLPDALELSFIADGVGTDELGGIGTKVSGLATTEPIDDSVSALVSLRSPVGEALCAVLVRRKLSICSLFSDTSRGD